VKVFNWVLRFEGKKCPDDSSKLLRKCGGIHAEDSGASVIMAGVALI
jgi:hypothetical protein